MIDSAKDYRTILGLRFNLSAPRQAVLKSESGGLIVFPSAPALMNLEHDAVYRHALQYADTVFPDSSFMVMAWNLIERDSIRRLSGLAYLRELIGLPSFRHSGNTLWVLPHAGSRTATVRWLATQGIVVPDSHFYIAPRYSVGGDQAIDPALAALIENLQPQHVIIGVGGGVQEPLGADLKLRLSYLPAIHCVGAAIAFLNGEQVRIPVWADRLCLGWLFRTLHNPGRFALRYGNAYHLLPLMQKYRDLTPDAGLKPEPRRLHAHI